MKHENLVSNELIRIEFPTYRDNEVGVSSALTFHERESSKGERS